MEIDEKLKANVSSIDTWQRFFITLGFGVLTSVVMMPVVWVLAGAQLIFQLVTGERNANLHEVNRTLSAWLRQVFGYMLSASDEKPFPFSDLPSLEPETTQDAEDIDSRNKEEKVEEEVV